MVYFRKIYQYHKINMVLIYALVLQVIATYKTQLGVFKLVIAGMLDLTDFLMAVYASTLMKCYVAYIIVGSITVPFIKAKGKRIIPIKQHNLKHHAL